MLTTTIIAPHRLELLERMSAGLRVLMVLLAALPLLAPYELLMKPHWQGYGIAWGFALVISLGAVAVSLLLVAAGLLGLNRKLTIDAGEQAVHYAYESALMPLRGRRYGFAEVSRVWIETHDWTDGPASHGICFSFQDGRKVEVGNFDHISAAQECLGHIEALLQKAQPSHAPGARS